MVGGSVEAEVVLGGGRLTPGVKRFWRERIEAGQPGHAEVLAWTRRDAAHFASIRSVFAAALNPVRDRA